MDKIQKINILYPKLKECLNINNDLLSPTIYVWNSEKYKNAIDNYCSEFFINDDKGNFIKDRKGLTDKTSFYCIKLWLSNIISWKKWYSYSFSWDGSLDWITISYTIINEKYWIVNVYQIDPWAWVKEMEPINAKIETFDLISKLVLWFANQIIKYQKEICEHYNKEEINDIKKVFNRKIINYLKNKRVLWLDEKIKEINNIWEK